MGSLDKYLFESLYCVLSQKVWQRFFSFSNCIVVSIFPSAGHSVLTAAEWLIIEYCPVWSVVVVCCGINNNNTYWLSDTNNTTAKNSVHTKYKILTGEMIAKWLRARVSTLIQVSSRRDRRKHPLSHLPAGGAPSQMKMIENWSKCFLVLTFIIQFRRLALKSPH